MGVENLKAYRYHFCLSTTLISSPVYGPIRKINLCNSPLLKLYGQMYTLIDLWDNIYGQSLNKIPFKVGSSEWNYIDVNKIKLNMENIIE